MRGPDFEIPPIDPPAPPVDGPVPEGPKAPAARRFRAAALAGVLALSGSGAFAWYSSQSPAGPPAPVVLPSTTQTTEPLRTSTSSTRPTTTTRAPVVETCVESAEHPAAAGGASPEGFPWITFKVSPRATRDSLDRIARAASQAREEFGDAGALGVRVYCEVQEWATASNTPPGEVQENVTAGLVALVRGGDIWIYGPTFEKQPASREREIVYHEYFHTLQRSLSRTRSATGGNPLWLIEGSARYFENAVTPGELESFRRSQIRRFDDRPALEELEQSGGSTSSGGTGHAYPVGAVAVDYLVQTYGRERIQTDFWVALGGGGGWRSAFLHVFGVSTDTFYADFATYRQTLRP